MDVARNGASVVPFYMPASVDMKTVPITKWNHVNNNYYFKFITQIAMEQIVAEKPMRLQYNILSINVSANCSSSLGGSHEYARRSSIFFRKKSLIGNQKLSGKNKNSLLRAIVI